MRINSIASYHYNNLSKCTKPCKNNDAPVINKPLGNTPVKDEFLRQDLSFGIFSGPGTKRNLKKVASRETIKFVENHSMIKLRLDYSSKEPAFNGEFILDEAGSDDYRDMARNFIREYEKKHELKPGWMQSMGLHSDELYHFLQIGWNIKPLEMDLRTPREKGEE